MLSKYDEFLKQHSETHAEKGKGHVSYLSSTVYEELVDIMGERLLDEIIKKIQISKYYGFTADSTTDIGHIDQLSLSFKYLENGYIPVKRFLIFLDNKGHTAQKMLDTIPNFIQKHSVDFKLSRSVSFDNASVVSGQYNGLQALVKRESTTCVWVPCTGL